MQPTHYDPRRTREPGDQPAAKTPGVEPYPSTDAVGPAVDKAFQHPEKVGHPDGVPHDVVGRTAVGAVLLAGIGVFAYFMFGVIVAIVIGAIALWVLMHGLPARARKERTVEAVDEVDHPDHERRIVDEHKGDMNA